MEPGVQPAEGTFERGTGFCRDSRWLLVQALRNLGLAARFLSGYLIQLKPDLVALDGPPGTDHDFTDLHAWAEAYLPGASWIGLDPTSGLLTGESLIPLAARPHHKNAAPISGLAGAANVDFDFDMRVVRVAEHPRITKPFSDEAWAALNALGRKVDAALSAGDVRLTMGGEPTFVSIDDFESAEWNAEAVGPMKRGLADRLIRRLRDRFAPGGFLHYGQGKWYPGETLPRWTFSLCWQGRGSDLARPGADLRGGRGDPGRSRRGRPAASRPTWWCPPSRTPPNGLSRGQPAPNVSPENSELKDPEPRHRIARVFARSLTTPSGYVLPIQRWQARADGPRWHFERWKLRRGHVFLVPGDSPAGYRLPLGALPHVPRRSTPISTRPTRPSRAATCPISPTRRSRRAPRTPPACSRWRISPPTIPSSRIVSSSSSAPSREPSAQRCRSSPATAGSASSRPRWSGWRTTSSSLPPSRRQPRGRRRPHHP